MAKAHSIATRLPKKCAETAQKLSRIVAQQQFQQAQRGK